MLGGRWFIKGLLTGSIIGSLLGAIFKPERKPVATERLGGPTRRLRARARNVAKQVSEGVSEFWRRGR